ncbi:MAG: cobaltochelatase subunit CobN, partial [Planctomycetota bacterium]
LVEKFVEFRLDKDLGWAPERIAAEFTEFMEVLHPYLDDVAQTAQPQGLAVFGETPDAERRFGMIMQMLRKRLIDSLGEDIDEVFLLDAEKVKNSRPARWLRLALADPEAASRLDLRVIDRLDTSQQNSVPNRAEGKQLDPKLLLELAQEAQRLDRALSVNTEIESLIDALDGKHIASGYGGDPVRNPESLPTGRNLYGFDPSRVPTRQAWEIGVGVLDRWIESYRQQHEDEFPTQIAYTLWAGETMRHHGVMEAQIFHALGVTPTWDASGRMKGIEIVESSELGRPRIDVLVNVTGSYRDQFPHLMKWIDKAVVAVADESTDAASAAEFPNFVARHASTLHAELLAQGVEPSLARRKAAARVFSNESGAYGSGLNNAVYASELWDSQRRGGGDAEMAELFMHRMGHAYGSDLDGVPAADIFATHIARVDAAFLSRSSNTYGVLTSDDPFAYLGGFALAARAMKGESIDLFVQNLRDETEVIVDPAETAIAKEMQTRYLHPQWIQAQQQEGYSGTLQVLKATQFLWGWQAIAPKTVREDQWQSLMDVYVDDAYALGARDWLQGSNYPAFAQMLERMVDAVRLDYWNPTAQTRESLFRAYRGAMAESGLFERNRAVSVYVADFIEGGGLPDLDAEPIASVPKAQLPTDVPPDNGAVEGAAEASATRVQGQELQPIAQETSSKSSTRWRPEIAAVVVTPLVVMGALARMRRLRASREKGPGPS